jgi:double-strand break repair protein AddB
MHGEGVGFDALEGLSPEDQSGHWERSLSFLRAIRGYVEALEETASDGEAIHRANVIALQEAWRTRPRETPVIVAGSTGSRATTQMLMAAVAGLPRGMVILPGFDFDLPDEIWERLVTGHRFEDHPQYRFAAFLERIGLAAADVVRIGHAPDEARNRLVSLSLRPAPVTDQWLQAGPDLGPAAPAVEALTLIEARDPREEAMAIALAMRSEIGAGRSVALIAPDATLARRVTAELSRWSILPDDSGGTPLSLTPAGRFLRQTARVAAGHLDPVEILALLKHPMTRSGEDRGDFMKQVQEFELYLRRHGVVEIDPARIRAFIVKDAEMEGFARWLESALAVSRHPFEPGLHTSLTRHRDVMRAFAGADGWERIFAGDAGEKIRELLNAFEAQADHGRGVDYADYLRLLEKALSTDSARSQDGVRPDAMIWGTLEARVQGADVVILGGLNEGTWPEQPAADPWLNRSMRREVGLLPPERQIGLAAHDYQQAVGASHVVLSRSARSEGSETVPSRWLNRLTNLLDGLKSTGGDDALKEMRRRGNALLAAAARFDRPDGETNPVGRPAPAPPLVARPRDFAVTDIQKLIRDPYSIYAKRILRLRPLDPLMPEMDARRKGTVIHEILERFYDPGAVFDDFGTAVTRLGTIAADILEKEVPDHTTRALWWSQLDANSAWLFDEEVRRREVAIPLGTEIKGRYAVPGTEFSLRGKADRIDRLKSGGLVIYDYKTGSPPTRADIRRYDRQLVLEAVMAEGGAFEGLSGERVSHVVHLGVGRTPAEQVTLLEDENETVTVKGDLITLLSAFLDPGMGYLSRRAMETLRYEGDYDHLARFGEWDASASGQVEAVG